MNVKTGVILAGGEGKRLDRPDSPKPLVAVGSKPMIVYSIEQMQDAGIESIFIVIGRRGEEIKKELTNNPCVKVPIIYVEQKDSSTGAMLRSILAVEEHIKEAFYLSMADLVIEKNPFEILGHKIKKTDPASIYSLVDEKIETIESSGAHSCVCLKDGNVVEIKRDSEDGDGFELGVYLMSPESLKLIRKIGKNKDNFHDVKSELIKKNKFKAVVADVGEWFDINTPATHIRANMFIRKRNSVAFESKDRMHLKKLPIFSYFYRSKMMHTDIVIERGALKNISNIRLIPEDVADSPHFILTDSVVDELYGERLLKDMLANGYDIKKFVLPAGESSKSIGEYSRLADEIFTNGMDEHSIIISLGGGVVNNMAGMLASTLYRGIGLIHIPTTTMAQVDAALDFKQAVNSPSGKNLIGNYYPASLILIDPDVIETLDKRHILNGISESIKHGLAEDKEFMQYFMDNAHRVEDIDFLEHITRRTVELKVPLLIGDVKDDSNEMIPQYGHAVGHAVEHLSSYDLLHGEAVSVGMCVSAEIARILSICGDETVEAHYKVLEQYDLPVTVPEYMTPEDVCNVIRYDKHFLRGNPHMALVESPGQVWKDKGECSIPVDYEIVKRAVAINQARAKKK